MNHKNILGIFLTGVTALSLLGGAIALGKLTAQPAEAYSTINEPGFQCNANTLVCHSPELAMLRSYLTAINNVTGAQNAFFGKSGSPHDVGNLNTDGTQGSAYQGNDFTKLGHTYDGNPWIRLSPNANAAIHLVDSDGNLVPNAPTYNIPDNNVSDVRWILTEVENQTKGIDTSVKSAIEGTNCLGNIYIFRNEYNPALMVGFYAINGSVSCSGTGAPNADQRHFVFHAGCENSWSDTAGYLSDVDGPDVGNLDLGGGLHPTDQDDLTKIKATLANTHNVKICTNDTGAFGNALNSTMQAMSNVINTIFNWVKDALLNVVNIGTLTDNIGLVNAWKSIRDFVNIIFILILITVAFSNILRVDTEKYGVRALLPRLVFAVIAVNFSFILVQILTNVAFIVSQPFLSKAFSLLSNPPANGSLIDPSQGIGEFFIALLLVFAVILGFLILFVFFVIRIIIIWMLAALSPFVFLFMVLPITRSLASSWWKNAVKWIFMAPVAFVLLFIAAELLATSQRNSNINGPDFALKVAFFLVASIAAVMIPLELGGKIMGQVLGGAKKGGGFGGKAMGKAGMFAADRGITRRLPGGGDATLGTRMRAAKAGLAARGELRDARAQEHLQEQMLEGRGVGRLAGAEAGQVTRARQQAIHRAQQEMATIPPSGKMRIAYAQNPGNVRNGHVFDENNRDLGELTPDERNLAGQRISREAAFSELAQSGIASPQLAQAYHESGLQSLAQHDPAMSALERSGTYNQGRAEAKVGYSTYDDMKGWDDRYLEGAVRHLTGQSTDTTRDYDRVAAESLNQLDATRAGYAVTRGHRNSMQRDSQRTLMRQVAENGGFANDGVRQAVLNSHDQNDLNV